MRCIICKVKFEPKYFLQKTCFEPTCIMAHSKAVEEKKWKSRKKEQLIILDVKKNRNLLQGEINKLARMIDSHFEYKCICCGSDFVGQIDGAHFMDVGGHENMRFNLHNIHAARAHCNQYSNQHKVTYPKGLIDRYGLEYYNMLTIDLPLLYKYLGLSENEIHDKLVIVRKLIREFKSHTKGLINGAEMRTYFNKIIKIYEKEN